MASPAAPSLMEELPDEEIEEMYDLEAQAEEEAEEFDSLKLGGVIELGRLSPLVQFFILAVGMFFFYVTHAYFQEKVFTTPGFHFGFFVSFFDFFIFAVLAGLQLLLIEGRIPRNAPLSNFFAISVALALSIGCGFASLEYLNYPTKVLFKSGKIIPTMLMGRLLFKRLYKPLEYIAAVMLCAGLAAFTLGQASVSPAFHVVGVALISVSALSESAVGNLQENVLLNHKCILLEIVFWSNLFSASVVFVYLVVSGELISGAEFVMNTPGVLYTILAECFVGYVGVFFYLGVVQRFGVAVCIGVSALRKVATICISFLAFPKPFTMMYVYGTILVLTAIFLTAYVKNKNKNSSRRVKTHVV